MHRVKTVNRFDFDNQAAIDQEIDFQIVTNPLAAVLDRDVMLPRNRNASEPQFEHQAVSIDRFKKPWTQCLVNSDRTADHQLGEFVDKERGGA